MSVRLSLAAEQDGMCDHHEKLEPQGQRRQLETVTWGFSGLLSCGDLLRPCLALSDSVL